MQICDFERVFVLNWCSEEDFGFSSRAGDVARNGTGRIGGLDKGKRGWEKTSGANPLDIGRVGQLGARGEVAAEFVNGPAVDKPLGGRRFFGNEQISTKHCGQHATRQAVLPIHLPTESR